MRIVCDGCQAKYSIADDKVRAKVFKIRCKKCSNVIVVRGSDAAEPVAAPPPEDDAIWHLVIDQEQVGPLTAADVHQRYTAGQIDGETFTWREGMDEWLPLAQVDAFAEIATGGSAPATAPVPLAARAPSPRMREPDHRDDLFGAQGAQLAAAPAESSAQKLRGERNESSVLFSLGNLAQIANQRPAPAAATPAGGASTATGGGEGSGLIDIRSMASAYLGSSGAAAQPRTAGAGIGSLDDLPVFGGGGFSEPAVLVPAARPATNTKILYVMIGAVALLATVAIVLMVMLLGGTRSAPQVAAAPTPPVEPKRAVEPPPPATPPPAEVKKPVAAPAATTPPATTPKAPPAHAAMPAQHKDPKEPKAPHATPPPAEVPAQLKAAKTTETCDDISCVVNSDTPCCVALRARSGQHEAAKKTETADPNLPPKLVVGQITSTMATVKAKIMSCGDRSPAKGTVKVHLKVNGDGKVTDASVETSPDTALGACVAAAAKHAVFPKTQTGGSFGIPYQF